MLKNKHTLFCVLKFLLAILFASLALPANAQVAKTLFGAEKLPAATKPQVHGYYSMGCVAGAVAMPLDGEHWQVMRLKRNRYWGHPSLINWLIVFASEAHKVGWNGLLVGDISQPRGGPMLTGHVSHQSGLDVDLWLNEMPNYRLSKLAREKRSAVSTLAKTKGGKLDHSRTGKNFTNKHFEMIRTAAKYEQVERIFVHPAIKKQLCQRETSVFNRRWLYKVRPYWGHHYHMHIRLKCPKGATNCQSQKPVKKRTGCGIELYQWLKRVKPTEDIIPKKTKRKDIKLSQLPNACKAVLKSPAPKNESAATAKVEGNKIKIPTYE